MLVTARPTLATGLLLWLTCVTAVVGEGDSGPRNFVKDLMICDACALGLQD